jgi:hypothetical protein
MTRLNTGMAPSLAPRHSLATTWPDRTAHRMHTPYLASLWPNVCLDGPLVLPRVTRAASCGFDVVSNQGLSMRLPPILT